MWGAASHFGVEGRGWWRVGGGGVPVEGVHDVWGAAGVRGTGGAKYFAGDGGGGGWRVLAGFAIRTFSGNGRESGELFRKG
jgi:hypothetical protein